MTNNEVEFPLVPKIAEIHLAQFNVLQSDGLNGPLAFGDLAGGEVKSNGMKVWKG